MEDCDTYNITLMQCEYLSSSTVVRWDMTTTKILNIIKQKVATRHLHLEVRIYYVFVFELILVAYKTVKKIN